MARKKRTHRRGGFTVPVAVIAGFAPLAGLTLKGFQSGGVALGLQELCIYSTGYIPQENRWSFAHLARGMGPVLAGMLVHKVAGKLGVNRALGAAGVPWVRV